MHNAYFIFTVGVGNSEDTQHPNLIPDQCSSEQSHHGFDKTETTVKSGKFSVKATEP